MMMDVIGKSIVGCEEEWHVLGEGGRLAREMTGARVFLNDRSPIKGELNNILTTHDTRTLIIIIIIL